jgi:hypothetical protein
LGGIHAGIQRITLFGGIWQSVIIPLRLWRWGGIVAAVFVLLAVDHRPPHQQKKSPFGEMLKLCGLSLHDKYMILFNSVTVPPSVF